MGEKVWGNGKTSRLGFERQEPELPGGFEELRVAGDEGSAARTARGPGQPGGELQGVGGLQREPIDQALGLAAQFVGGEQLLPVASQLIQSNLSLDLAGGR